MKTKTIFVSMFFILFFLLFTTTSVQASPIKNFFYNTLTFLGIIEITNANHLNSDRVVISDVYNEVKELDGIWSEEIPDGNYIRVRFEKNLTNKNDITIFPRTISENPRIEVYEIEGNEIIATFDPINSNQYNKVFLTNLQGEQSTFDLRIIDGSIEFEHIIDPYNQLDYSGFESGEQSWTFGGTDSFRYNARSAWQDNGASGGSWSGRFRDDTSSAYFSKAFNFTGYDYIIIKFSHYATSIDSNEYYQLFCDATEIMRCTEGSGTSVNMVCTSSAEKTQSQWNAETFTIYPANCTFDNSVTIQFKGDPGLSADDDTVDVDGINITAVDETAPAWSNSAKNQTNIRQNDNVKFNASWTDGVALNGFIFAINQTGNWVNSSYSTMTGISNVSENVTQITATAGTNVSWYFWTNDSLGNSNQTDIQSFVVASADTCTCPGNGNNWEINMADSCNIVDACDLGAGNITFIGTGTTTFNSTINCKNLEYPTTDQMLYIGSNAIITIG